MPVNSGREFESPPFQSPCDEHLILKHLTVIRGPDCLPSHTVLRTAEAQMLVWQAGRGVGLGEVYLLES
jgi:hypothetical protein